MLLKNTWEKAFLKWLLDYCEKTSPKLECKNVLDKYGAIIFDSIYYHYLDPNFFCGFVILVCPPTMEPMNLTEDIQRIVKNKPQIPLPTPTRKSTFKVLQVTDIHLDPQYIANATVSCSETLCCRKPSNSTDGKVSGYWGTLGSCDLPLRTAEQMAMFISKNVEVDFVIWTGDNSQHDIDKTSNENIDNTLLLSSLFKTHLPGVTVYPSLGNHETYPLEVWNFKDNPKIYSRPEERTYAKNQAQFQSTFSSNWKDWLGAQSSQEFSKNGFYSSYNQKYGVRIISLNTNACHNENFYLLLDPTDPGDMLTWLNKTLAQSEQNKESVYIIGHVPPGSSDCFPEWSNRFSALVERYSHLIRGQFFGHFHSDSFFIYKSYLNKNETVNLGFLAPSMTPNSNRNPSFRVYEIDFDTKLPINYYQYRLNLTKANLDPTQPLQWEIAYDFLGTYGYKDLGIATFDDFRNQILKNQTLYSIFSLNYGAGLGGAPRKENVYCGSLSTIDQNYACLQQTFNITVEPGIKQTGLELASGIWFNKTSKAN